MNKTKQKNILFYIPVLTQEFGGIRQYAASLLKLLAAFPEEYFFYILHENNDPVIIDIVSKSPHFKIVTTKEYAINFFEKKVYKIVYTFQRVFKFLFKPNLSLTLLTDPFVNLIKQNHIDIIHCPYQYIPDIKEVKLITTMHDVQELHFPEFFTPEQRADRAVHYNDYIKRAHAVLVSYDHIKKDIIKYFSKQPDDVIVALMKMDNLWFSKYNSSNVKNARLTDIPGKYLFYPANTWYHKNHENLIRAVYYLKTNKLLNINIIFTGENSNECGRYLLSLISDYNLESQIKFLGVVDEEKLYSLYQNAWGIVIPTLYEAGSFPLIESILMQLPVICSNVTSLPETIGNDDFIFDPLNIFEIGEKIEKLWNDDEFRLACKENTYKQQNKLIDTGASQVIEKIYRNLTN